MNMQTNSQEEIVTPNITGQEEVVAADPQPSGTILASTDGSAEGSTPTEGQGSSASTTESAPSGFKFPDLPENWRENLPEEIRADQTLQTVNDIPTMAKMLVHAQKAIGAEKIALPSKHATDDERREFQFRLGLPQTLEQYEVKVPENTEDIFSEGIFTSLKEQSWKAGIMPDQFNVLAEGYANAVREEQKRMEQEVTAQVEKEFNEMKQELGQTFDAKIARAKQVVDYVGDQNFKSWLVESGMGDNPMMIKAMIKLGDLLSEDTVIKTGGGTMGKTVSQAQGEITKIMTDMGHPYHNEEHPGHKAAVEEMKKLNEAAFGG